MTKELKRPNYEIHDGFIMPGAFSLEAFRSAVRYKPKPNDLFIVTYPKCGTTWLQHITMLIIRKGKPITSQKEFFQITPFIEMVGADAVDMMPGKGAIKTHFPFKLTPYSPEAKYIYLARNPKDCCVSFYHHTKSIPFYNFEDGTFDEYFELFINGKTDYEDYFDHLLSWYEHKDEPNIYFMTYEKLKKDTKEEVLKLAKFMGEEYYESLKNDPEIIENVLKYSSLDYMKSIMNSVEDSLFKNLADIPKDIPIPSGIRALMEYTANHPELSVEFKGEFVRKGIVGDWKNHFNEDHIRRMEDRILEKTWGTVVMNLWK